MTPRKAVFAGSWYPDKPSACEREIQGFLSRKDDPAKSGKPVLGGIVPHAGWYFSGKIACNVIRDVLGGENEPDVTLIFGMHLHRDSEPFIMADGAWETPLGELEIATSLAERLTRRFHFIVETARRFTQDNTIELQLPFIKYFSKHTKILPVGAPPSGISIDIAHAAVEEAKALGMSLAVIGSTDLTHYGPNYGFAPAGIGEKALSWVREVNDAAVIQKMRDMDPEAVIREALKNHNACCGGAAASAIAALKKLGATQSELLSYQTSHDKSPGNSFVGYAGVVFR